MVDEARVLSKISELDGYLKELKSVLPKTYPGYKQVEKKRSCERLLQLMIECVIDVCKLFVSGLKLGIPSQETDLFEKMLAEGIISRKVRDILQEMRAFRNILVHEYAVVDDEIVFDRLKNHLRDFEKIKKAITGALKK